MPGLPKLLPVAPQPQGQAQPLPDLSFGAPIRLPTGVVVVRMANRFAYNGGASFTFVTLRAGSTTVIVWSATMFTTVANSTMQLNINTELVSGVDNSTMFSNVANQHETLPTKFTRFGPAQPGDANHGASLPVGQHTLSWTVAAGSSDGQDVVNVIVVEIFAPS